MNLLSPEELNKLPTRKLVSLNRSCKKGELSKGYIIHTCGEDYYKENELALQEYKEQIILIIRSRDRVGGYIDRKNKARAKRREERKMNNIQKNLVTEITIKVLSIFKNSVYSCTRSIAQDLENNNIKPYIECDHCYDNDVWVTYNIRRISMLKINITIVGSPELKPNIQIYRDGDYLNPFTEQLFWETLLLNHE